MYARLVAAYRERGVDFSAVRTFNLDEYVGLPAEHAQSYRSFMRRHLFDGLELPPQNVHFPPTDGPDLLRRCRAFEDEIRAAGGIDIQLLGIGTILEARRILVQSFGRRKAEAVRAAIEGPISSFWPASALHHHADTTFYLDPDSASLLAMRDDYRQVRARGESPGAGAAVGGRSACGGRAPYGCRSRAGFPRSLP